jgi:hypothetical protein
VEVRIFITWLHITYDFDCSNLFFARRRGKVAGQKPPRAKPSPAIIPPTPDAPVRPTGPSASSQHASKMADAPEKSTGPSDRPIKGARKVSFSGKAIQVDAGTEASKWQKKSEALFRLDNMQEEASNNVSSAMTAFVQRTSLVKEVCTPSSPRAPWRI